MAFRYVIFSLCAVLACAQAGFLASHVAVANPAVDAVASTQHNVVRSFAGTVSSYSKAVDTPYSSVRKSDTRIQNNVYQPAIAKTTYSAPLYTQATPIVQKSVYAAAAPVLAKTVSYAAPAPVLAKTFSYAAPAVSYGAPVKTVYAAPAPVVTKTLYAAPAPVVAKTIYSAAPVYAKSYAAPAVSYAAPLATTHVNHGPSATTYSHNAPALGVSSYGSAQTVHYSPAESVSHMSFDGFGTHWGF
ncbi:cuticle protein 16.5 [Drosophila montana]|uniref:cuticle protein 16.5 n=1 Tax=Drosophila montana TaxID=40370 RepID=UPI00313C1256